SYELVYAPGIPLGKQKESVSASPSLGYRLQSRVRPQRETRSQAVTSSSIHFRWQLASRRMSSSSHSRTRTLLWSSLTCRSSELHHCCGCVRGPRGGVLMNATTLSPSLTPMRCYSTSTHPAPSLQPWTRRMI